MNSEKEFITENPFAVLVRRMNRIESQNEQILSFLRNGNQSSADEIGGMPLARSVTGLSEPRIYTLVSKRAIPHFKRGNRLYFSRTALENWVREGNRSERKAVQA